MFCFVFVFALGNRSGSLFLFLTLSLSLPVSLYSFCSGYNIDCDSGIFLGFALFGCCMLLLFIRDHNTDCIFLCNCIVCLYCVSLLFIRDHYIDLDKLWNLCVGICIDCLYCVLLFKKWLGPCGSLCRYCMLFNCLLA